MSGRLPERGQNLKSDIMPTGPALLALVKRAGERMLAQENHHLYLAEREIYLELLVFAERDEYCRNVLIPIVQDILDRESLRPRVDKTR